MGGPAHRPQAMALLACAVLLAAGPARAQITLSVPPAAAAAVGAVVGRAPGVALGLGQFLTDGFAAVGDVNKIAAGLGLIGGGLPGFGVVHRSIRSLTLNAIQTLNGLNIAKTQAGAGVAAAIGEATIGRIINRVNSITGFHTALLGEAGKALGSGVAAIKVASRPLLALNPASLALEKLVVHTNNLVAFLEGFSDLGAGPAKDLLLRPYIASLRVIRTGLGIARDTFAGRVPLLNAIADASKLLAVADVASGSEVTGLLGRALDLIGSNIVG